MSGKTSSHRGTKTFMEVFHNLHGSPEWGNGVVVRDGDIFRVMLRGANLGWHVFVLEREAYDALAVARVMYGRDPDTGELVK